MMGVRGRTFPTIGSAMESFVTHILSRQHLSRGQSMGLMTTFLAGARGALLVVEHHAGDGAESVEAAYRAMSGEIDDLLRAIGDEELR